MSENKFTYIIFNKPYGIECQFSGENPDITLAKFSFPKNVYPVGRLDKDSEGLLVLSDDGNFINKVLAPKFEKEKTYWVQVENIPDQDSLKRFSKGLEIKDYKTKPCKIKIINDPLVPERIPPIRVRKTIPTAWLEIIITEGKNRQVRRMTAAIGHPTLRLIRFQVGKINLKNLKPGEWIKVNKEDII